MYGRCCACQCQCNDKSAVMSFVPPRNRRQEISLSPSAESPKSNGEKSPHFTQSNVRKTGLGGVGASGGDWTKCDPEPDTPKARVIGWDCHIKYYASLQTRCACVKGAVSGGKRRLRKCRLTCSCICNSARALAEEWRQETLKMSRTLRAFPGMYCP
jgi:hypothetical protein